MCAAAMKTHAGTMHDKSAPLPAVPNTTASATAVRTIRIATLAIATHVVVDSFLDVRPGVVPADHIASSLVPLAALGLFCALVGFLRAGVVALMAGLLGVAVTIGGIAAPTAALVRGEVHPGTISGAVAAGAGVVLVATGLTVAFRSRRREGSRRRRWSRRASIGGLVVVSTLLGAAPLGMGYVVANRSGPIRPIADLGGPHEEVTLQSRDGLAIAAAYVPSGNGAAVILYPGVAGDGLAARARMLVDHGYGVLAVEPRGHARSEGDPNLLGWTAESDLLAAIDFLEARPEVESGRIGGLGLSVGGELMIQTAAHDHRLSAVVSEGAGTRWFAEDLHTSFPASVVQLPFSAIATISTAVFSDSLPPSRIEDLVGDIAPRPLLLIWTSRGIGGEWFNPLYHERAGSTATIWEIPESSHVGGLAARPAEYEQRVVGFFDEEL